MKNFTVVFTITKRVTINLTADSQDAIDKLVDEMPAEDIEAYGAGRIEEEISIESVQEVAR